MEKKIYFSLKGKEILLYGAASIGNLAFDWFEENGWHVAGYVDKRGHEIKRFRDRPVYGIQDEAIRQYIDDDKYVVFVSVKNVFEHSNIAKLLVEKGFYNIIYRPISVINGSGTKEQKTLNEIYDMISAGDMKDAGSIIPKTYKVDVYQSKGIHVLRQNENDVVIMVSIDSLHTDRKVRKAPWFDKPVLSLLPHIDLFRYINGEKGISYDRYMDYCILGANGKIEVTDAWKRNVIKNRSSVYEHMKHSLELENDFFVRNAPDVAWNKEKGVFNLQSGKHRAAFFTSLKRHYIPLKIKLDDYESYLNVEAVKELTKYLEEREIVQLPAPIGHPLFFDYPCECREFYYGFLYELFYRISEKLYGLDGQLEFDKLSIYCKLNDYGFVERALRKAGCSLNLSICENERKMIKVLDKLFYCDLSKQIDNDLGNDKPYDYMILDGREEGFQNLKMKEMVKEALIMVIRSSKQEKYLIENYQADCFFCGIADGQDIVVLKIKEFKIGCRSLT